MSRDELTITIVVICAAYGVGLWVLACMLTAKFGGWGELAARFRASGAPPAALTRFAWGRFRNVRYGGMLGVGHSDAGLWLSMMAPVRPFHPPLLIPWSELRRVGQQHGLGTDFVVLEAGGVPFRLAAQVTKTFEQRLRSG